MVFLPECFDVMAEKRSDSFEISEYLDGSTISTYRDMAKNHDLWLSLGGFHKKGTGEKMSNSHVIIDNKGNIRSVYDKLHMFDAVGLRESDTTERGQEVVPPVETPIGRIGLQICYDLRFGELSTLQTRLGAQILTFPSAFTKATGEAHWHALLCGRAIENQCYVIAAAQTGQHNAKRSSYGHSMVVDPWGQIIAECVEDEPSLCFATIDLDLVDKCRSRIPTMQHRRTDISGLVPTDSRILKSDTPTIESSEIYAFSHIRLPSSQVFYRSELSFAFVNIKPVLEGHVLVSPLREVKQLSDLSPEEVTDLFRVVQTVSTAIKRHHGVDSLTVAIQDGVHAGQTIKLQTHDKHMDAGALRDEESMRLESYALRESLARELNE